MISFALRSGRINVSESKSFVVDSRPTDWQVDSHGHGTHVARLLLQTAPTAEIYVAKICKGDIINNEFMRGTAQVRLSLFTTVRYYASLYLSIPLGILTYYLAGDQLGR